jgi:hypothetical protein
MKKTFLILLVTLGFGYWGLGQVTLPHLDPINYTVGQGLQTQAGWTTLNTGDDLLIASGSLSFTGLETSTFNKVTFSGAGIDAAKLFTQQGSGTVYYSFLLDITALGSLGTTGGYFTGFTEGTGTTFGATVWSRSDGAGFDLGINPRTTAANTVWSSGTTSLNETLFIVISYEIVTGTTNDIVKMWINPTPGSSEPTPTLTATNTLVDLLNLNRILIRQDGTSATPFIEMDELRIGTAWADVTPPGTVFAPTIQASNITFDNILQTQMDVLWTNGNGAKRVVKINTSNIFTAPADGTDPTAISIYGGSGQQVVYNGSGNTIPTVSGLTAGITYWFRVYEYNGSGTGTLYCTATGTNNPKSQATPAGATAPLIIGPTATAITATSAILGGNITADGGSSITERGTVWSTTSPVTISDNKLAEGGTTTGIFTHSRSSLPFNTLIYFAAYATNSVGTTLTDESSFTTLLGEPTNHAANFTAVSLTYSSITVTWLDNDGAQPATGFVILANTTGTFTNPEDGVPIVYDSNLGDGSGVVTVNHGNQTFTWYSLVSSTPYYFTIYPYTNSGTNIDYKVTPAAPTATTTTLAYIAPLAAWTFDDTPANPNTPTSVAANIGFQTGTAMLYADGTSGSSAWLQATELNAFGGTEINDPREGSGVFAGKDYVPYNSTANGKSIVLWFSMEDYQNPVLTFATRGSGTGFNSQQWAWSVDNITYTNFGINTAENTGTYVFRTLDMSDINDLDQAVDVYLRVTFDGATSASGNNRLDNIVIHASEPSAGPFTLNLKVFLEGPYNPTTNVMSTDLLTNNLIPPGQPFNPGLPYYGNNTPKWLYSGTQSVTSFPAGTVDYVLIELRDAASPTAATSATRIAQVPALLKSDGSIVSLDGTTLPSFTNAVNNFLYIIVWSRNHVGIMSSGNITPGGTVAWDFTTGAGQFYGTSAGYKEIETGVWGMAAGDINADGNVDALDKSPLGWKVDAGKNGYLGADLNMNTQVSNKDKNDFWVPNNNIKSTQVPN